MSKKFFIFLIISLIVFGFLIFNFRESEKKEAEASVGAGFLKAIGGAYPETGIGVIQTPDGGYIITGVTDTWGVDRDAFLMKLDFLGNLSWQKAIGGTGNDVGRSIIQTIDGNYIVAGYNTYGTDAENVLLIKFDLNGNILSQRTIGKTQTDMATSISRTTDGGYIVAGYTNSPPWKIGEDDVLLLKFKSDDSFDWGETIGKSKVERFGSIIQTTDGGYIVVGFTFSWGAGDSDIFIMKLDSFGNYIWWKTIGGVNADEGRSVIEVSDGYILVGMTYNNFGAVYADIFLVKFDLNGNFLWAKRIDGSGYDSSKSIVRTTDGGYIVSGFTGYTSYGYPGSWGAVKEDIFLLKFDSANGLSWARRIGGSNDDTVGGRTWFASYSTAQATDGGYILTGDTKSWTAGYEDILILKTDGNGNITTGGPITSISPTVVDVFPGPGEINTSPPAPSSKFIFPDIIPLSLTETPFTPTVATLAFETNVSGWAWSENIGWISFNWTNCDTDNNGYIDVACGGNNSTTPVIYYGVDIDPATGNFSGYAWSENIGWISFAPTDTTPDGTVNPAKLDLTTGKVTGWARALSYGGGWDGWIKLRCYGTECNTSNYGLWLYTPPPTYDEFRNWAWGSDVIGWISFNVRNCDVNGNGQYEGAAEGAPADCPTLGTAYDYKVITTLNLNSPPYVESGSQIVEYQQYCNVFAGQGQIGFRWTYKDPDLDPQTQFDFRVNDVNNVNDLSPEVDRSFSGLNNPDGTINNQVVLVGSPLEADKITFNTTYYWWVRVWDSQGKNSGWVTGPNFTTKSHSYPWVDFTRVPQSPSVNEIVQFTDASEVFGGTTKTGSGSCLSAWCWTFPDGNPSASTIQNPQTKFTSSGSKNIALTVTDSDNLSCSGSKSLNISFPLPEWREVPPTF